MLFSIIVPVYNVETYLDRCVTSLIKQTYKDIEIILVDDGSTDSSSQICDKYKAADNRIQVIHKKNGGLSDARNKGLQIASGEYIFFVDSDDYIDFNTCKNFSYYASLGYDVLIGDAITVNGNSNLAHKIEPQKMLHGHQYLLSALQAGGSPMAAWLNVYRKTFLIENNLYFKFGILHEDEQFTPRVFLKAQSVIYTDITFYHYVIRKNSICQKKDKRKNAQDMYNTCCELENIYHGLEDKLLKKYLLDSLSCSYLDLFQSGKLYQYGKNFLHKSMVYRNAKLPKTRLKALLYTVSPRLYYCINKNYKKGIKHV